MKNLVIVESPAKAKTISKYLGKDYQVLSSYGHIRDLPKKNLSIDTDNDFQPTYVISPDKKKRVTELKKAAKTAETVWLATDEDREGEAIAWHLVYALDLQKKPVKRIVFHEITKEAITNAIDNPREVDQNLVDAQQARRVLDRLVGYELSPVLWRKVRPGLSAGRVQSVAVRLIVEREREIESFDPEVNFKVEALFGVGDDVIKAETAKPLADYESARKFTAAAPEATFKVSGLEKKPGTRNPSPPFTTSTLQQTAAGKLGMSVAQTMTLAQRLYESGHITYMRTDSFALAKSAVAQAAKIIEKGFGKDYLQVRAYQAKAGAQEAHEAIRPTDFGREEAGDDERQRKLYSLIRSRALASQMTPARLQRTTITIGSDKHDRDLLAKGEVVTFPGFLRAYTHDQRDDTLLPNVENGQTLPLSKLTVTEQYQRHPARYSEAALVRKLEEMGIGRPSTYAPTISTIQARGYVEKGDVEGSEKPVRILRADNKDWSEESGAVLYGRDKNKLIPTPIAKLVSDFLTKHFSDIVDYDFTRSVEEEFDKISAGKEAWNSMIADFYGPFHDTVKKADSVSREEASGARELGNDPESGKPIIARMGRFGPMLQKGHAKEDEKPQFAPIPKSKSMDSITLEEALQLFSLPREVGKSDDGQPITATYGRYGPYVKANSTFAAIPEELDPFTVDEKTARELIRDKLQVAAEREIADFGKLKVLKGRYGPYISDGKKNAKIPKDQAPEKLSAAEAKEIFDKAPAKKRGRRK